MEAEDMLCVIEKLFLIASGLDHLLETNYGVLIHDTGHARRQTLSAIVSGVMALREGLEELALGDPATDGGTQDG